MACLESLPPELLLHVLAYLPIRSLLAFSLTSRSSCAIASTSLHTLSLGIYPTRISSLIGQLATASPTASPYSQLHPHTLLAFHTALTSSILSRYCVSIRHLDLSIWSLTQPVAAALARLKNLGCLSLRIEDPFGRGCLRRWAGAWDGTARRGSDVSLSSETGCGVEWNAMAGAWGRLEVLRLDGADISDWQLCRILDTNVQVKELWAKKCPKISKDLLNFLAYEWGGKGNLNVLGVAECDASGEINGEALGCIGELSQLKFLNLYGCKAVTSEMVERLNAELWHIPTIELPHRPDTEFGPGVIEVDPDYLTADE
ncbi:hypothetical protein K490DRAFT_41250 [Saccharata proteae CBS 121410]|uniref:F-box domain-containing protein n=1 Tax=Saccharata proteae CBS 121410 TaxID=1314787 RepID=A0A9P4LZ24_9PEZI|nr:hypothetical protein K490DRAFT_41250 [Saccharata proteae CBS 121410]